MRAMIWAAALLAAGAATAEPGVNVEELKLYPERYAGKTVTLDATIWMVREDSGMLVAKTASLGNLDFVFHWNDKSAPWERAQCDCRGLDKQPECAVRITGTVQQHQSPDGYFIDKAKVEFLTSPK
mgnify:CR=1 FL=1